MSQHFAKQDWVYNFELLPKRFDSSSVLQTANALSERYSKITKAWSAERNSEWLCRSYTAAKLIMSATLHISSAHYASEQNLRVVVPYLKYYAAFSLCRAICLTVPERAWSDGRIFHMGHKAAIEGARDHLVKFDKKYAKLASGELKDLKANRELISYHSPSSGDGQIRSGALYLEMCRILAEVAQFNSEILERSIKKNADPEFFMLLPDYAYRMSNLDVGGEYFGDVMDALRIDYVGRKILCPINLQAFMTEGHVDDFFGSWTDERERPDAFDPDTMTSIIFDIP